MPIYEYLCPVCRVKFERLRPMSQSDAPATCPAGHEGAQRAVSRFVAKVLVRPGDDVHDSSYFGEHGRFYHEHDVYSTPPGMDSAGHGSDSPAPAARHESGSAPAHGPETHPH